MNADRPDTPSGVTRADPPQPLDENPILQPLAFYRDRPDTPTPQTPEPLTPGTLRLTGAQLAEIAAMWPESGAGVLFVDFDEYEDFAARSEAARAAPIDVEALAEAISFTNRNGWANGITPLAFHAWASAIATVYARLHPEPSEGRDGTP